ncbi:MAG: hypothetical protein PVJ73_01605 [Acidobacteriota bacterium]|jgi:hypothetical protein
MAEQQEPFADIEVLEDGFSIPDLKWRELVFVGALRAEGDCWARDPSRPLPPFRIPDLFPDGARFRVERRAGRAFVRPEQS